MKHFTREKLLWLHNKSCLLQKKENVTVKWFGISFVFMSCVARTRKCFLTIVSPRGNTCTYLSITDKFHN